MLVKGTGLRMSVGRPTLGYLGLTHSQTIKEIIPDGLGLLLEKLDIFEDLRLDCDFLLESHRIFTQEIKLDDIGWCQRDVFISKRTATDGIGFILALFVTRSQGQSIDKVHGGRSLPVRHDFGMQRILVVLSDRVDVFLVDQRESRV